MDALQGGELRFGLSWRWDLDWGCRDLLNSVSLVCNREHRTIAGQNGFKIERVMMNANALYRIAIGGIQLVLLGLALEAVADPLIPKRRSSMERAGLYRGGTPDINPGAAKAVAEAEAAQKAEQEAAYQAIIARDNNVPKESSEVIDRRIVEFLKYRVTRESDVARYDLAKRYLSGRGVIQNEDEATKLLQAAATNNHKDSIQLLRMMADRKRVELTPLQSTNRLGESNPQRADN